MKLINTIILLIIGHLGMTQFHSLPLPTMSPPVSVTQQLGVTAITIKYGSPSVRGRDVWSDGHTIPYNGNPIPWRAGANMNTTIAFDTDVYIEGQKLPAGQYGFHILPGKTQHTLLFANRDNLWGSYYLDTLNDITLKVTVKDTVCPFMEHLGFAFLDRKDSTMTIALEWADKRIPFEVKVDLIETTLTKVRYALNGENTYRWEAWNDAASWCLEHQVNLTEALTWVNRSINGGYYGFAANHNMTNQMTKIRILHALNRGDEFTEAIQVAMNLHYNIDEAHQLASMLIELKRDNDALAFIDQAFEKYKDDWGLYFLKAIAYYYQGTPKKSVKLMDLSIQYFPGTSTERLKMFQTQMSEGTYQYLNRNK